LIFTRGLAALIFSLLFSVSLHAKFLYKDDVVHNDKFAAEIEHVGQELYDKTGISLYLVMVRDLEQNQSTVDFEKSLVGELQEPFVLLTFVELRQRVDILARPLSLYKDFDKKQVLSPNATFADALASAVMFGRSLDNYKEMLGNYGGTILPVLGEKTKGADTVKKYSVAMYNGYADISDQIAASKGVKLSSSAGNGGKIFLDLLRLVFYGTILIALIIYIRNKIRKRKNANAA
jgi:hypothetical protein